MASVVFSGPVVSGVATYILPPLDEQLIGSVQYVSARRDETLLDIARRHGVGHNEIKLANPGVDMWLPGEGTQVLLPTRYILPDAPREGIVLNVPEMRLYYYPKPQPGERPVVQTYPISIGRGDWETPLGTTTVVTKTPNPTWRPPESIKQEHAARGEPLPDAVPPGPDNPLGKYALRLGLPGYLIHGTNRPFGIGMRVTHGCVRMYPEDIDVLFEEVAVGTPVHIVHQPFKIGWALGIPYFEAHPPFGEDQTPNTAANLTPIIRTLIRYGGAIEAIDFQVAQKEARAPTGVPLPVAAVHQSASRIPPSSGTH
ncbi:MAG: L,D-transpeptidase family protein [Gammaproteobacteria bacterium]|nr:L,D-transpeptidase family protein [Gammaproteobacteria bacterium]